MILVTSLQGLPPLAQGTDGARLTNGRFRVALDLIAGLAASPEVDQLMTYGAESGDNCGWDALATPELVEMANNDTAFVWFEPARHHLWWPSRLRAALDIRFPIVTFAHGIAYADQMPNDIADLASPSTRGDTIITPSNATTAALSLQYQSLAQRLGLGHRQFSLTTIPYASNGPPPTAATQDGTPLPARPYVLGINRFSRSDKCDWEAYLHLAFRILRPQGVQLVLAGGALLDTDLDFLRGAIAQLGLGDVVILRPNLSETDKTQLMRNALFMVALSITPSESFGLVLIEALSAGLPVVCTDWSGYSEILGHGPKCGVLIPTHWDAPPDPWSEEAAYVRSSSIGAGYRCRIDQAHLMSTVATLLREPVTLRSMSRSAIKRARQFSFPNFVSKTASLMSSTLHTCHSEGAIDYGERNTPYPSPWNGVFARYATPQVDTPR